LKRNSKGACQVSTAPGPGRRRLDIYFSQSEFPISFGFSGVITTVTAQFEECQRA
jgi:hypothetical protein